MFHNPVASIHKAIIARNSEFRNIQVQFSIKIKFRMMNVDCMFLDFFDGHDIWHFMGGSGSDTDRFIIPYRYPMNCTLKYGRGL